jgi:hypothetical protein
MKALSYVERLPRTSFSIHPASRVIYQISLNLAGGNTNRWEGRGKGALARWPENLCGADRFAH